MKRLKRFLYVLLCIMLLIQGNITFGYTSDVYAETSDTEAPTVPTGLSSPSQTNTTVNLEWTASTDNEGVTGYDVYNGATLAGSTTGETTYTVTGLATNTTYSFTVKAKDAAGNTSDFSTVLFVTTLNNDIEAPTVPTGLASPSQTNTTVNLIWTASTDNVGVTGYDVYNGATLAGSTTGETTYTVTGLATNTTYSFTVKAKDAAGNTSDFSTVLSVTTLNNDIEAPTVPTGLASPSQTNTTVNLVWTASTDNVGVTGYDVYNGATLTGSTTGETSYTVTGLATNTTYSFTVKAKDAAGNISDTSAVLLVTTFNNVTNVSGTISQNTTWTAANSPYILNGNITIQTGVTLTIQPGVLVKNSSNSSSYSYTINVQGNLDAIGTLDNPIVFTTYKDSAYGGSGEISNYKDYWAGINVSSTGSFTGDNVKLRYGAAYLNNNSALNVLGKLTLTNSEVTNSYGYGVYVNGIGDLSIIGNRILNNSNYPICVNLNGVKSSISGIQNNTFTGNKKDGVPTDGVGLTGDPTIDLTLSSANYYLLSSITIPSGVTLTIQPGVIVKNSPSSSSSYSYTINVQGILNAIGTSDSPIVFTAYKDSAYGGSGVSSTSNKDYWAGINVSGTGTFTGDNVKIRYGAAYSNNSTLNVLGKLTLTNSEVSNSYYYGVAVYKSDISPLTLENCIITENKDRAILINQYGIAGDLSIKGNNIINNSGYPIYTNLSGIKSSIFPGIQNNTYTGNIKDGVTYDGICLTGSPTVDLTLSRDTYYLSSTLSVPNGTTLTIHPGVIVKGTTWVSSIYVQGKVNALGTSESPIVFTTYKDSAYGGSGVSTTSYTDYWAGVNVSNTGEFTGENIKLRYGAAGSYYSSSTLCVLGKLTLTKSEVTNSYSYGAYFYTTIQPVLEYNTFLNNPNGMYNYNASTMTIDAKYNYWGSNNGPKFYDRTSNKWVGDGDKVSAGINYTPWLNSDLTIATNSINSISGNPESLSRLDPTQIPQEQMVADPVDTASGAHIIERSLLEVTGTQKMSFDIRYNSLLLTNGPLGKGREYPYETYLETQSNGDVIVHWSTNRHNTFNLSGSRYVSTDNATKYDNLTKNTDGTYTLKRKDHSILDFDESGKLTDLKNGFGQTLVMTYDSSNRLSQIQEPISGKTFTLGYNSQGLISSLADNANRSVTFTYDQSHNLIGITDSRGTITYTYDNTGRILTETDLNGIVIITDTYDQAGRVISQKDSLDHQITFDYDESTLAGKLITSVTDRNGNTMRYTFNAKYELLSVQDELSNLKEYTYDSYGNRISFSDENGNITTYTYDTQGNLLTLTDPLGHITWYTYDDNDILLTIENALSEKVSNTYDANGNILTSTDPLGNTTTYTYNAYGQVLTKTVPSSGTTTFTYQDGMLHTTTDPLNQTTTFDYDAAGRMIAQTDSDGHITTYEYDLAGNILGITDPLGHTMSYTYDANGNKLTETDAQGLVIHFDYDTNGKLIKMTDPLEHKTTYVYDPEERVIQKKVYDGTTEISTVTTYDLAGRVLSVQDPEGDITSYTYDQQGNVLSKTEPGKGTTNYTYDANGKVLTETDAANNVRSFAYNDAGRLISETNPLGKTTTYAYDANGQIISVTNPLGHSISYTYDSQGNKLTETDANGNVTSYTYDANGKLIQVTDALNHETQYQYDGLGHLTKVIDAKGNETNLTYDAAGRLIVTTDALGNTVTTQYDEIGRIIGITDALGHEIMSTTYDSTGNPLTITDALGNLTTNHYDDLGRLITITDSLNHITSLNYDQLGRLVSVVDPLQGQSNQTFEPGGNIKTSVDPNNNQTVYDYDLIGRLIQETTAIGNSKNYTYNALNLISEQTNGRGQETSYRYDDAGRLISLIDLSDTINYTYDNNGNVLTVTDSMGTITRYYDQLNRVTKYTDREGNSIEYTYDEVGNLKTLTYPGGKVVEYAYNAVNQLVSVTDWANRITEYEYDVNGRLTRTDRPDGSVQTMLYDNAGRVTQQKDIDQYGEIINKYAYTYDQVGNIVSEESSNELSPPAILNATMTYTQNNQLATYNGQTVEYDADGNMISGPLKGSITNFSFDSRNRLISAGTMSYGYDAENNRLAVITNGQQTHYVINPQAKLSQVLIKTDAQGNNTYYVYGLGLVGQEDAEGLYKSYHFDNRGSTTAITDIQGEVTDAFAYAPFGELMQRTGTTDTPFLYNGRDGVMTDSNGLYYMRARYYNPDIKRFINQDVLQGSINNGQSLNRYAYVNGNPVSQVDPFGLCAESTNSNSWMHLILGSISFIPGLNVPASLLDFGLYLKEGDHVNAGIAMACIVPFAKEGVLGVKVAEAVLEDGSRIIKAADEAGVIGKVAKGADEADVIKNWKGEVVKIPEGHVMSPRDPSFSEPPIYREGPFTTEQRDAFLNGESGGTKLAPHHRNQIPVRDGGVIDELPGPGHPEGNIHTGGSPSRHPAKSIFNSEVNGNQLRKSEIYDAWNAKGQRLIEVEDGVWIDPGFK